MTGSTVGNQEVEPPDRILAPSKRVPRARRVASCSAMSSASVAKRQRPQIVLAVVAFLLAGTAAQHEGSSVASYPTPRGTREAPSAASVFQHSTETRRAVEQDLQSSSTEGQPDLLALGINLYTGNPAADPVGATAPVHTAGTSWDPSKASGLLSSSSPVDKNRFEVLGLSTSSLGGALAETGSPLDASSSGLRGSTVTTSVLKPVGKGKPGLFPTISPTSLLLSDAGGPLHLDVTPALQTAPARPLSDTAPNPASGIAQPTSATVLTSPPPPAPESSPQGEQDRIGTLPPLTKISHRTHLDQRFNSHGGDVLPLSETGFLARQALAEAATSPEMLGRSLLSPTLPTGTVPSEATHIATDIFHSSSVATTYSFWESKLRVSTGRSSGCLSASSPDTSSKSMASLQKVVLNGQGPGGTELATRDTLESASAPTPSPQSSSRPLSSSPHGLAHAALPDFVTELDSLETKGLATDSLPWHRLVPTSMGTPKLEDGTALSASTDGAPVTAEKDTGVPLGRTSQLEELETRDGVSEDMVPSVHDLATVSAFTSKPTLSDLSTLQDIRRSEATSGFPIGNTSSPVSHAPRNVSSIGTVGQLELGTTTTHSPHSSPSPSDGAPVTTEEVTGVLLGRTSQLEELETRYGIREDVVPAVHDLITVSAFTSKPTLSDLSTPQDFPRSEATSGFPVGGTSSPVSHTPRTDSLSSSSTVGQLELDTTSQPPHTSPSPSDGAPVTTEEVTGVPLGRTSQLEELETHYGVSEDLVPAVHDLATVSAFTSKPTLSDLSTPQIFPRSEATSGFPVGNTSLPVPHSPRNVSSSGTVGQLELGTSTHSPHSSPSPSDGAPVTTEEVTGVPLGRTSQLEELETRYGVREVVVPSVHDLATVSTFTGKPTLSDLSTPQIFPRSEAASGFPVGSTSLPVSQAPRTDSVSSSGTVGQLELGTTTHSPHSSPSDGAPVTTEEVTGVPLGRTSQLEELETRYGVREVVVPSVHDLANVSAFTGKPTLSDLSTPQFFPRSEAASGFPVGNTSFPVSQALRTDSVSSSSTVGQLELGTTTHSPHSSPSPSDGAPATAEVTGVPLGGTSQLEELETRYGVREGMVPSARGLATVSAFSSKPTLSDLSTLQDFPSSEAASGFPVGSTSLPASQTPRIDSLSSSGTVGQLELGTTTQLPHSSPAGTIGAHFSLSTVPLDLETVASYNPTEAVLSTHKRTTLGERGSSLGSTSWVRLPASLGTTEEQEGFPTTEAIPSPSPKEGTGFKWKEEISPTGQLELGTTTQPPPSSPAGTTGAHFSLSAVPLDLGTVAAYNPTEEVLSTHQSTTLGERSSALGATSWVRLPTSLGTTEEQEGFPTIEAVPSPSPDGGIGLEWKKGVSPTSQMSTDVPGEVSTLAGQSDASSTFLPAPVSSLPTPASSLPTFQVEHSGGVGTGSSVPFLHSLSTSGAVPSADVTSVSSTFWVCASLGPTEEQEDFPTTEVIPSPSPDEGASFQWKEGISPTLELSTDVPGEVSILADQSEHASIDVGSTFLPTLASSLPTFRVGHSGGVGTGYSVPFLHSLSTSGAVPSADVTHLGSYGELGQHKDSDGTIQVTTAAGEISDSTSGLPLATSGPPLSTDSSSSLTSAILGVPTAWENFVFPGKRTRSASSPPPSPTFLTTSRMTTSKESSEPATEEASSASVPASTTRSNATLASQFLDIPGVTQPFQTTAGGMQNVGRVTGSPTTGPGRELFSRTPSEWRHPISTLSQAVADRTEVLDTSRAAETSVVFVRRTSYRASSKASPDLSLVETKSTVMSHPKATQLVSLLSNTAALLASSRILPTASRLTTNAACSGVHCLYNGPPASLAPLQRTSAQLPRIASTVSPKVLVTTLDSTVGKKGTTAGLTTKVDTPTVTHATVTQAAELNDTKPGTITRDGPTSERLVSPLEGSTVGQTAERNNFTLSKRTLDLCVLPLEFHLARIDYTKSLGDKASDGYKKLEREVTLTLNKMLSFYESFLQANVLRFLRGSVIAQCEAVFQGEGFVPTPSDLIRTIVTAVEQRNLDAFFDWRVDLKSLRSNGFSLKNLDPEVLAISFMVLGQGSIATFGGLTDWGPLERQRNEVVGSLGARYRVQNFSLIRVRNLQGDLDISGEIYVNTDAHVDIDWALEALKGLANYSVDLGSVCINGSQLRLHIFPVSFLVTNRIFTEKLLDRSSVAHQTLSWDLSNVLMHTLGQFKNLLQVTIREVRSGSLICHVDVIFQPPAPTSEDLVHALVLSVGPKNYLGGSSIQVDPFSFSVAGAKLEPPFASPGIPGYAIALIVLGCLAVVLIPVSILLYNQLGWKEKMVIHRGRDPEVMVETFELDNPGFRSLAEVNSRQSYSPTEVLS